MVQSTKMRARKPTCRGAAALFMALSAIPAGAEPPVMHGPAAPAGDRGTLTVTSPYGSPGTVILRWDGTIATPMAQNIEKAIDAFRSSRRRFVLVLNSGGGSVAEGERVIALLQKIRATHQLDTAVERGGRCGSMCVPIYLQGQSRFGARSSAWLFHEITRPSTNFGKHTKVEGSYMRLIEKYWIPAGVSKTWVDRMLQLADGHDYWQTGENLINDGANIITRPLENRTKRNLDPDTMMPPQAKSTPPAALVAAPNGPGSVQQELGEPFGGVGKRGRPAAPQQAQPIVGR